MAKPEVIIYIYNKTMGKDSIFGMKPKLNSKINSPYSALTGQLIISLITPINFNTFIVQMNRKLIIIQSIFNHFNTRLQPENLIENASIMQNKPPPSNQIIKS